MNKTKIGIISLITLIFIFLLIIKSGISKVEKLHSIYAELKVENSLNDRIISIEKLKGSSFVTTSSGKYFIGISQNKNYRDVFIDENLFIGDTIYKRKGSDTIYIYRDSVSLEFLLRGIIQIR